jgi:metallo-beta-lactamase class B
MVPAMAIASVLALLLAAAPAPTATPAAVAAPTAPADHADQNQPFPPHRIADNLYYVGSRLLASYLVTTKKGHILVNSGFESTVPLIRANVEQLGFKFADVKILLASHAHDDHVEGHALVKQLTGARVHVMQGDDKVIASGGQGQYMYDRRWKPCPVDRVLADGDKVTLGGVTLVARRTPGHTRGCTTWTMRAKDGGKTHDVVIVGSPNVNAGYRLVGNQDYPEIAADFAKSFQIWRGLACDIFLGAHGKYYGLDEKFPRLAPGQPNPFIDPQGYRAYIDERDQAYRAMLQGQQKEAQPQPAPAKPSLQN